LKKAFSLIEVLVAVSLITTVIVAILQMQQNNIFFLEKFKNSSLNNAYISLVASTSKTKRNKDIILSDMVDLNDDDIRKEFKEIKIKIKDSSKKDMELPKNDYVKGSFIESTYSLNNMQNKFYSFKFE
jgi:prepilin-type N-terminal cleavage/methylation domain-containing protein